jgi:hypothetical protein
MLLERGADKMALTADGKVMCCVVFCCVLLFAHVGLYLQTPRDLCVKWSMKKFFYSRPEYEVVVHFEFLSAHSVSRNTVLILSFDRAS